MLSKRHLGVRVYRVIKRIGLGVFWLFMGIYLLIFTLVVIHMMYGLAELLLWPIVHSVLGQLTILFVMMGCSRSQMVLGTSWEAKPGRL